MARADHYYPWGQISGLPTYSILEHVHTDHEVSPPASSESSLGHAFPAEKGPHGEVLYQEDLPSSAPKSYERKLITKIDFRVLPILCIMFTLAFLDKVNIANAETFGLSEELELKGNQYNNCVSAGCVKQRLNINFSPDILNSLWCNTFRILC